MFESATFARGNVRKTSRRLGLRSDSSARFEKGIETYTNNVGLSRALHLVQQLDCGKVTKGRICIGRQAESRTVAFAKDKIHRLLGIVIPDDKIKEILNALNIQVSLTKDTVTCIVPPYRDDIVRDCDIVEELIRVYGYDNINGTLMENSHITCGGKTEEETKCDRLRTVLTGMRYNECVFYPFGGKALFDKASLTPVDEGKYIRILNPIGEELSLMNRSLVPNMLQCVSLNLTRSVHDLRLFEIGKAYLATSLPLTQLPKEEKRLCVAATEVTYDAFSQNVLQAVHAFAKSGIKLVRSQRDILHPGISADILIDGKVCGSMGKIHPQIAKNFDISVDCFVAELTLEDVFEKDNENFRYKPFGKFPSVTRDFAFVADEDVAAQDLLDEFLCLPQVAQASLFDVYRSPQLGEGKKSLAVTVEFKDNNKTLQDEDVAKPVAKALKNIKEKYGAELR